MKKILSILILICYLLPAVGFSMDLHWCGKKVNVVSINSSHGEKCPCKSKMAKRCCKDVHVSVKISDNQNASSQLTIPQNNFAKQLNSYFVIQVPIPKSQFSQLDFSNYHAPPIKGTLPVYISYNIFRI